LTTKQNEILSRKRTIESELKDVLPLIEKAKKNVSNIKYQDMNEIKNYKICPSEIRDVITGILMFFKDYDCSWGNMKKFLGNRSIVNQIVD